VLFPICPELFAPQEYNPTENIVGVGVGVLVGVGVGIALTGIDSVDEDEIAEPDCVNVSTRLAVVGFGVTLPPLVPPMNEPTT
jgi:hypothetical protein